MFGPNLSLFFTLISQLKNFQLDHRLSARNMASGLEHGSGTWLLAGTWERNMAFELGHGPTLLFRSKQALENSNRSCPGTWDSLVLQVADEE